MRKVDNMDLWILNQNKDMLKKCDQISLYQNEDCCEIKSGSTLGRYDNVEIAKKILNDIAQRLREGEDLIYTLPSRE